MGSNDFQTYESLTLAAAFVTVFSAAPAVVTLSAGALSVVASSFH